jgi:hypothetical protein
VIYRIMSRKALPDPAISAQLVSHQAAFGVCAAKNSESRPGVAPGNDAFVLLRPVWRVWS